MPTGYTADIANGIDFRTFALQCARAFGALITMRDEPSDVPIPDKFEPSDYSLKALNKARGELKQAKQWRNNHWQKVLDDEYKEELKNYHIARNKEIELKVKYENMLNLVSEWEPPTPEHKGMKDFMIKQISDSLEWDCDYYSTRSEPKKPDFNFFKTDKIASIEKSITYHQEQHLKESKRANERTVWVQQLKASLPAFVEIEEDGE